MHRRVMEKKHGTRALPVAAGASGRARDVGRIRGWTDSTRWQGGSRGLGLSRGRGRNGPYDAHVAPTYPVLGRMLPAGGLRALRQPTTPGASGRHRATAGPWRRCLIGHRASAVQRCALRSEIQITFAELPRTLGRGWFPRASDAKRPPGKGSLCIGIASWRKIQFSGVCFSHNIRIQVLGDSAYDCLHSWAVEENVN